MLPARPQAGKHLFFALPPRFYLKRFLLNDSKACSLSSQKEWHAGYVPLALTKWEDEIAKLTLFSKQ